MYYIRDTLCIICCSICESAGTLDINRWAGNEVVPVCFHAEPLLSDNNALDLWSDLCRA